MFESIGDITAQGPVSANLQARRAGKADRRTHEPVRRQSRLAGRCEAVFWRPTSRAEVARVVLAARRYELAGRQAGKRSGPIGHVGIEILELLANMVSFKTGQLDPSIETLMRKLGRSRDAIVRALKALRAHGFLDWLRRYVPTGNQTGPQVQQTSNAYRLSLPNRALQLLGRFGWNTPLPDDFAHAQADRKAAIDAQLATLEPAQYAAAIVEDEGLAAVLGRLGKAISDKKERESVQRTESRASFKS